MIEKYDKSAVVRISAVLGNLKHIDSRREF